MTREKCTHTRISFQSTNLIQSKDNSFLIILIWFWFISHFNSQLSSLLFCQSQLLNLEKNVKIESYIWKTLLISEKTRAPALLRSLANLWYWFARSKLREANLVEHFSRIFFLKKPEKRRKAIGSQLALFQAASNILPSINFGTARKRIANNRLVANAKLWKVSPLQWQKITVISINLWSDLNCPSGLAVFN